MYDPSGYQRPEPYGQVQHLAHRRTEASSSQSYGGLDNRPTPYASYGPSSPVALSPTSATSSLSPHLMKEEPLKYQHNLVSGFFLFGSLLCVLSQYESPYPGWIVGMLGLALYSLDLANLEDAFLYTTWISAFIMSVVCGWFTLIESSDDDTGIEVVVLLLNIAVYVLLFFCTSAWLCLQLEWLQEGSYIMERSLHALLPLVSSAIFTQTFGQIRVINRDATAMLSPFLFATFMTVAMLSLGSTESRVFANQDSTHRFLLSPPIALVHSTVLFLIPPLMHLATSIKRIISRYASTDDWYEMTIIALVPFLLLFFIHSLNEQGIIKSPYAMPHMFPSNLRGELVPMAASLITSLALQQRHLIPLCHSLSYHLMGTKSPAWLVSLYWTLATVSILFCFWAWDRKSSSGALLFGEYHEDVVQLGLSLVGLTLGKAFGLPWNFTPLPILAFLGLSIWLTTRMLRYLAIFLFVIHATGVVVFSYRFAGIEHRISVLGVEFSLIRLGLTVTLASVLAGLVAGLAVRSTGGFGATIVKKVDLTGLVLIVYSLLLMALEVTLIKRPVPTSELVGVVFDADHPRSDDMVYDHSWSLLTSLILAGISLFMKRVKILSPRTAWVVLSLAIGKAVAVFIDATEEEQNGIGASGSDIFLRSLVGALLCIVIFAPRVFLHPVHMKITTSAKRFHANGKGQNELSTGTSGTIIIYTFIFLPLALAISIPYVIIPLINSIAMDYRGNSYYSIKQPVSELAGTAFSLWGLACLSMLNYYLPDGGGDIFKKISALAFLMGVGIIFAAPTITVSIGEAATNPYAAISSIGSQLLRRGKSRTGGWGLLSAAFATLLAITGPLSLRERKSRTGKKDRYLLLRAMLFSLLFGCGVAWFIIMKSMSEADWASLFLTSISCMSLAFLGTIASVLGYFIELENFKEVEQITKMWVIVLVAFVPVSGLSEFLQPKTSHPFGGGGWLSTYLAVCCIFTLGFSLSLSNRSDKNRTTRSLGNLGCLISWLCSIIVLYGRYGVAGLDVQYNVTRVLGVPASVFGTVILSAILLALQSESSENPRRIQKVSSSTKQGNSIFGLHLPQLDRSNRFYPLVASSTIVFIAASLYTIFLRGSGFFDFSGGKGIAKTHEHVFSVVFGDTTPQNHDLAELASKTIMHSQAIATSARLAGSGFWTADSFVSPTLHLVGIAAALPSHYLALQDWWFGNIVSSATVAMALPLNAVPLFLCRGIPSLRAAALLGLVVGLYQISSLRQADRQSRMRI